MSKEAILAEISEDLDLIGPMLKDWLKTLPPAQKELLQKEFYNASHLFAAEDLFKKFKDKNILNNEPLQTSLGLKEETMQLIYSQAYEEHRKGADRKARALFRFLSFLNPKQVDYWMGLGTCFFIEGRIVEALGIFEIARAVDEENPEPYFFIARCHHILGDVDKALLVCRDAVNLSEAAVNAPCYHASRELEKQLQNQLKK